MLRKFSCYHAGGQFRFRRNHGARAGCWSAARPAGEKRIITDPKPRKSAAS